jgi:hypothetical protein
MTEIVHIYNTLYMYGLYAGKKVNNFKLHIEVEVIFCQVLRI